MKFFKIKSLFTVLTVCWFVAACSSSDDDASTGTTGGDMAESVFSFSADAPNTYTRVDRSGMPAIATALISSKDGYNDSNPTDDSAGVYVPEILTSLTSLHNALDEQLRGLSFTPCTVLGDGEGTCAKFAVPLIIPDTLKINTANPAGFPNGRKLEDPVIDVTLAVALLELTGDSPPHAPTALVGVLNPAANDKDFVADFPFLASPH